MRYETSKMKYEYKYRIPVSAIPRLKASLAPFLFMDPNMSGFEESGYTVRSIYYDTADFEFYDEKKAGLKIRKKLRIRGYNRVKDDSVVFLEIKRKDNIKQHKNRAALYFSSLADYLETGDNERLLIPANGHGVPAADGNMFLFNLRKSRLFPVVKIMYERLAFFGKFDPSFRITFDMNVRCDPQSRLTELYEETDTRIIDPGYAVFEVKYYHVFPSWLRPIIESFDLKRQSYSKYTKSIDTLFERCTSFRAPLAIG